MFLLVCLFFLVALYKLFLPSFGLRVCGLVPLDPKTFGTFTCMSNNDSNRLLLTLRGFFGFVSLSGTFFSIILLPLADATILSLTSTAFTAMWAFALLREKCKYLCSSINLHRIGWPEIISIFFSIGGVVLIVRPPGIFGDDSG